MIKSIAVSMSSKCVSKCSFCYRKHTKDADKYIVWTAIEKIAKENPEATICWEYNGWKLDLIEKFWLHDVKQTLTTMPSLITKALAGYLASRKIEAVALSYDSEKCTSVEWRKACHLLRDKGLKVSCNFLLEEHWCFPMELTIADQINLLSLKPNGKLTDQQLKNVKTMIELLRAFKKPVTTDNCLAVQLGNAPDCGRGTQFLHICSDGTVEDCSFGDKCYLYSTPHQIERERSRGGMNDTGESNEPGEVIGRDE